MLRHLADVEGWKYFYCEFPNFTLDSRNVRMGLASDGFNAFGNMNASYSMWHVALIPYNLLHWIYMKESNFFMSLTLVPSCHTPSRTYANSSCETRCDFKYLDVLNAKTLSLRSLSFT